MFSDAVSASDPVNVGLFRRCATGTTYSTASSRNGSVRSPTRSSDYLGGGVDDAEHVVDVAVAERIGEHTTGAEAGTRLEQ